MVESALNILIKELDFELRDPWVPDVEVSFVGHDLYNRSIEFLVCHSSKGGA